MEYEPIPGDKNMLKKSLERLFDLDDPKFVIIISDNFGENERKLLSDREYKIVIISSVKEAQGKEVLNLLLNAQAILNKKGDVRTDLPSNIALVIPTKIHNDAILSKVTEDWAGETYGDIFKREKQYTTIIDERKM